MLVLSRKVGEEFVIDGNIRVRIVATKGGRTRLAIDAPREVRIIRGELLDVDSEPIPYVDAPVHQNQQAVA